MNRSTSYGSSTSPHHPQPLPSPDPTFPDLSWLSSLPSHPILTSTSQIDSTSTQQNQFGLRSSLICIRSSDLILATRGSNELRSCSLIEAKHAAAYGNLSSYKVSFKNASLPHKHGFSCFLPNLLLFPPRSLGTSSFFPQLPNSIYSNQSYWIIASCCWNS